MGRPIAMVSRLPDGRFLLVPTGDGDLSGLGFIDTLVSAAKGAVKGVKSLIGKGKSKGKRAAVLDATAAATAAINQAIASGQVVPGTLTSTGRPHPYVSPESRGRFQAGTGYGAAGYGDGADQGAGAIPWAPIGLLAGAVGVGLVLSHRSKRGD